MFYTNCGKVTINGHKYIGMMTRTRPAYYTQYHGIELQLPQRKATKMFLDHGRRLGACFYLVGKSVADEDSQRRDEGFINSEWRLRSHVCTYGYYRYTLPVFRLRRPSQAATTADIYV